MDTSDRLGLGCGMAIFLFLPGTPRLVISYLQRKGQIAVLFISTPSDYSSDPTCQYIVRLDGGCSEHRKVQREGRFGSGGTGEGEAATIHRGVQAAGTGGSRRVSGSRGEGAAWWRREGLYSSHLAEWRRGPARRSMEHTGSGFRAGYGYEKGAQLMVGRYCGGVCRRPDPHLVVVVHLGRGEAVVVMSPV